MSSGWRGTDSQSRVRTDLFPEVASTGSSSSADMPSTPCLARGFWVHFTTPNFRTSGVGEDRVGIPQQAPFTSLPHWPQYRQEAHLTPHHHQLPHCQKPSELSLLSLNAPRGGAAEEIMRLG